MRLRLLAPALVLLLLPACGDDADEEPDAAPGDTSSEAADDSDDTDTPSGGCAFVDLATVQAAAGDDLTELSSGPTGCTFTVPVDASTDPDAETVSVSFAYTEIAIGPATYAEGTRDLCEDEPIDVDAGDVAFACTTFVAPQGFVYDGSDSVVVQVDDAPDDAAGVAIAAEILAGTTAAP